MRPDSKPTEVKGCFKAEWKEVEGQWGVQNKLWLVNVHTSSKTGKIVCKTVLKVWNYASNQFFFMGCSFLDTLSIAIFVIWSDMLVLLFKSESGHRYCAVGTGRFLALLNYKKLLLATENLILTYILIELCWLSYGTWCAFAFCPVVNSVYVLCFIQIKVYIYHISIIQYNHTED